MDQPKNNNTSDIDFGTEGSVEQPKINRYTEDIKVVAPQPNVAAVNPKAAAPEPTPVAQSTSVPLNVPQKPTTAIPLQTAPGQKPGQPAGTPPTGPGSQKVIIGCLGAFGVIIIILLILSFVFLAQAESGDSPIAKLLGVDHASFVNGLITFVYVIFILISLVTFVFAAIGFFRSAMAKKGDIVAKRAGLRMGFISGGVLLFVLIVWAFVFMFLDSKRVQIQADLVEAIITTPEDTLNLSAPVEVIFDASNVPIDSENYQIVSYDWDFGDKSKDTAQIVSHIYKEKGIFEVKLVITLRDKGTGELSTMDPYILTVSVTNQALAAIFTATPQSGEIPLKVEFDASESVDPDGNIKDYEWDLDNDGEFDDATGVKTKHEFTKIGKYTVALRVTSSTGEFNVAEKEIDAKKEESPQAKISVIDEPTNYVVGTNYTFSADGSTSPNGKIDKYEWNFNDGTKTENLKTVSHIFKAEGTYEVLLKVTDEKKEEGEVKKKITVGSPKGTPKAKIKTTPEFIEGNLSLSGKVPFTVTFNAGESTDIDKNIVEYAWDFESDGKFDAFGENASHTFNSEGNYTVTLQVSDSDKNIGKASVPVSVIAQGIIASIKADKVDGTVPLTIQFDASGSSFDKGQIISYQWDFGDGSPQKNGSAIISHKYAAIGNYTATVTVVGSDNSKSTKTINITVREIPLAACFLSIFEEGPAPLTTTFDPGCSTGTITNYFWDFGDGATSTDVKPDHTFNNPGNYKVTLEVSDNENTIDKAELNIVVK